MRFISPAAWPHRRYHSPPPPACCGWPGCPRGRKRTTLLRARNVLWAVRVKGWTQTSAANIVGVGQSTASRIMSGSLFPGARPLPIPGFSAKGCARYHQDDFGF